MRAILECSVSSSIEVRVPLVIIPPNNHRLPTPEPVPTSTTDYSAGSVTAALFLEKFTGKRKWVHLDVAGTARSESDAGESPKGGTGFGVRVLIDWIMSL